MALVPREHPDGDSVRRLTAGLVDGEANAFHELVAHYGGRLLRLAVSLMPNHPSSAEDVFQETLIRVVKNPRVFETEAAMWNWLAKITRNLVIDLQRAESSRARILRNASPPTGTAQNNPDLLIHEALEKMPREEADLLRAKYLEGRSSRELAAAMGLTEAAVDSRMARARCVLRGVLVRISGVENP